MHGLIHILSVIQGLSRSLWILLICLSLSPNLHQSSVAQLKTHMGIDFRPEPCGLNSKRACQKSQREGRARESERKSERAAARRTETSPNERLTKIRCRPEPDSPPLTCGTSGKKTTKKNKKQQTKRKETKITQEKKAAFSSALCVCCFHIFNKEINAHFECVRWATICRRALMCSLQRPLKSCTPSSSNKGNKIGA